MDSKEIGMTTEIDVASDLGRMGNGTVTKLVGLMQIEHTNQAKSDGKMGKCTELTYNTNQMEQFYFKATTSTALNKQS